MDDIEEKDGSFFWRMFPLSDFHQTVGRGGPFASWEDAWRSAVDARKTARHIALAKKAAHLGSR